ncbi:MAG: hypothetical protein ABWX90_03865 [Candidatus Saccharimonadales bacterium]
MIRGAMKYLRTRFGEKADTLDEQLDNSAVSDEMANSSEEVQEYEVASAIYPIAVWTHSVAEQMANESEAERLQRQINEIDEQLQSFQQGILQMKQKLDAKFGSLVGELFTLRAQLEAEFLRLTTAQRNEDYERESDRDHNGLTPEEQAELDRIEAEVNGEDKESRKRREEYEASVIAEGTKVFRQIAMRTHPDRTSNKALHAIFKEAKDAYEKKQWGRLHELWNILGPKKGGASKLFEALMSRIGALREQLRNKEQSLVALKSEKEFGMWRDYQHKEYQPRVEAHYKALLEFNIRQTKQVLASMGAQDYESFLRNEVEKDASETERQFESPRSTRSPAVDKYFRSHSVMGEKVEKELDSPWAEDED